MLPVFNELEPFFLDNYREYSVREYAREADVSPPTASKRLRTYADEGLLEMREERGAHLYRARRTEPLFIDLQRAFFRHQLTGIVEAIEQALLPERIILFGSAISGEFSARSDIDIFIDTRAQNVPVETHLSGHEIQFHFRSVLTNPDIAEAIESGLRLA